MLSKASVCFLMRNAILEVLLSSSGRYFSRFFKSCFYHKCLYVVITTHISPSKI